MLEKIKAAEIEGRCFGNDARKLVFFPKESQRIALVFGKNGSGKSTISRAFQGFAANNAEYSDLKLSLLDYRNRKIKTTTGEGYNGAKERIFVFNEDYVTKNVGLKSDGLDTIVLFGEQVEVDQKIEEYRERLEELEILYSEKVEVYKTSDKKANQYKKTIMGYLKKKNGWAETESRILGRKISSVVNDDTIQSIDNLRPDDARSLLELQNEYDVLYQKYCSLTTGKREYPKVAMPVSFTEVQEMQLIQLLGKKLERPEITGKDRELLSIVQNGLTTQIKDLRHELESGIGICPHCYQPITTEYRDTLLKTIDIVLNEAVKNHETELSAKFIAPIVFDVNPYATLNKALCNRITEILDVINEKIQEYDKCIREKLDSMYSPIEIASKGLSEDIEELKKLLVVLKGEVKKYYDSFSEVSTIQTQLLLLNKQIAYKGAEHDFREYYRFKKEYKRLQEEKNVLEQEKKMCQVEIERLEAQKKDVSVSVDYMNRALEYVFFSKNRMEIMVSDGCYTLKSKGVDVKPTSVSCGERNIIALCYFFSQMMDGLELNALYTREMLLMIDDPVSSFDSDNRIGIISYLKWQVSNVLFGNENSRVVFFSHDLYTIDCIAKFAEEICNSFRQQKENAPKINGFLFKGRIEELEIVAETDKEVNEYSRLLKCVYEFADSQKTDTYELIIGNVMRRLLEAFATFEYQKGIAEVSTTPEVLEQLSEDKRLYFNNLMYRLVLNGDSHTQGKVDMAEMNFYTSTTLEEKIKTARQILCLMYGLNRKHIELRFKSLELTDAISKVAAWYEEIG